MCTYLNKWFHWKLIKAPNSGVATASTKNCIIYIRDGYGIFQRGKGYFMACIYSCAQTLLTTPLTMQVHNNWRRVQQLAQSKWWREIDNITLYWQFSWLACAHITIGITVLTLAIFSVSLVLRSPVVMWGQNSGRTASNVCGQKHLWHGSVQFTTSHYTAICLAAAYHIGKSPHSLLKVS